MEIKTDFITEYPLLEDGSSSMKLPGISLDNGCANIIADNEITDNFGGGIGAGSLPAIAGYPHLTVPMGAIEDLPVGLSIFAGRWQDHEVLKAGTAYEKARTAELPTPSFKPWEPAELPVEPPKQH